MNTLGMNKIYGLLILSLLTIILSTAVFVLSAQSTYTVLVGPVNQQDSTEPYAVFMTNTVQVNYQEGALILSTCPDQPCSWAIDDAIRLTVTHPDQSQDSDFLVSLTADLAAVDVSYLFESGVNTVFVELVDIQPPFRSSMRTLFLIQSDEPLPEPDLEVLQIWQQLWRFFYPNVGHSSDPVNTFTGDFTYVNTDLATAGRGPTPTFVRSYNSGNTMSGDLGPGWLHNYNMRLYKPSEVSEDVIVLGANGRTDFYTHNTDGSYSPPDAVTDTLIKNANGMYTLTSKDQFSWVFSETGLLLRLVDRYGNQSTLGYNGNNQVTSVTDPAGRGALTFSYNNEDLLESVTDWLNREVTFSYDGYERLTTVTDREGAVTTYSYDGTSQRLTTITDARGNVVVTNTYDGNGRVATQKDAAGLISGQQTTFNYVTNGNGTKTTTITYPKTSFETSWNFVGVHTHDADGNLLEQVSKPVSSSSGWVTVTKTYDANGNVTSVTDGLGKTTNFCYDVDYSGSPVSGSYSNLTRRIDPQPSPGANRPVTLYQYDSKNNLVQEIPPKGVASGTTVTCSTDLSNSINLLYAVNYDYDTTQTLLESVTSVYTDPDIGVVTATTTYEYDDPNNPGLITKMIPSRGNTTQTPDESFATTYQYGASSSQAGMLTRITAPLSTVTTYQYDAVGRVVSMVAPRGNDSGATAADFTWEYVYDNEDRQTFVKAPPPEANGDHLITQYQYDGVGNQVVVIDANGQVTKYVYDIRDNLKEVHQSPNTWTNPNNPPSGVIVTGYQYDHLGNLTRVVRAQGNSTYERVIDYVYDGLGRVRKEIQYPNWPSTTAKLITEYTYDKNSNQLTLKDPLLKTTTFGYDVLNRMTSIIYNSTSTPNVSFTYDANNNRISMTDGAGTTSYTYDEWNRLLTVTAPGSNVVEYRYDQHSNKVKLIYPDDDVVVYTYDEADRMFEVEDWSGRITTYGYFVDGSVEQLTYDNGTSSHYTYDNTGRLTQVWIMYGNDTITRHTYTLDAVGNRIVTDEVLTDGYDPVPIDPSREGTIEYEYDGMYRLVTEHRDLPNPQDELVLVYGYDPVGNRLSKSITDVPSSPDVTTYTYDRADRIIKASGDEKETFTIDANGNMTDRYPNTFSHQPHVYDQENRLIRAEPQSIYKYYYSYDGEGKRTKIRRQSGSTTVDLVNYIYDVNQSLPVLIQDTWHPFPSDTRKYVWGLGLLYTIDGSDDPGFYHLDGLGSVRAITDDDTPNPRVQMYEEYDAFGNEGWSNRNYDQPFKFTGEQDDAIVGDAEYIYLRARYYDPTIARFLTRDSHSGDTAHPLTLNRYTYVENNPANKIDPSGHGSSRILRDLGNPKEFGASATLCPSIDSCLHGPPNLGPYERESLILLGGLILVLTPWPDEAAVLGAGGYTVYQSVSNGIVRYIGITNNFARRAGEHLSQSGRTIRAVPGLTNLSGPDARAVEQVLIERHGLPSTGGTLQNLINSISPNNPAYQNAIQRGNELLRSTGN